MLEYRVYLMKHGVYEKCVRCDNEDEANIVIDMARNDEEHEYEKYLLIVRDKVLDMPVQMETDYFSALTHDRKGR